jgi:protoheme IX farnesyltransferase
VNARVLSLSTTASDLLSLAKPRLASLVLLTMGGGMWIARGTLGPARALTTLLATGGIIAAANALNCYLERDSDRLMSRTRNRPLPAGRMDPQVALWFALTLITISVPALALSANFVTALLGLAALLIYDFVYTPMKARSWAAMLIGGIPGALPTLMGWTAVTGSIGAPAVVLFAILYFWQMPHFLSIALFRKDEYATAGLKSVPLQRGDRSARAQILVYLAVLIPVSLLLCPLRVAGWFYGGCALGLGAVFFGKAWIGFRRQLGVAWARQLFAISLCYLAGLYAALWLDTGRLQ